MSTSPMALIYLDMSIQPSKMAEFLSISFASGDNCYYNLISISYRRPVGYLTRATTELGLKPAPIMAAFSSKGPSSIAPEILKVL